MCSREGLEPGSMVREHFGQQPEPSVREETSQSPRASVSEGEVTVMKMRYVLTLDTYIYIKKRKAHKLVHIRLFLFSYFAAIEWALLKGLGGGASHYWFRQILLYVSAEVCSSCLAHTAARCSPSPRAQLMEGLGCMWVTIHHSGMADICHHILVGFEPRSSGPLMLTNMPIPPLTGRESG